MFVRHFMVLLAIISLSHPGQADEHTDFFESRIRPLLTQHCWECHSRNAEGGLRLDSREGMLQGGDRGTAVHPGAASKSLLLEAVSGKDDDLKMPPEGELSRREIEDLKQWIDQGAVWPDHPDDLLRVEDEQGIRPIDRMFWSFQPISRPVAPENHVPGLSAIDRFLNARQMAEGVSPVARATPRELIRRVSFDLTGLPPSVAEVERFLQQTEQDAQRAYSELIDRLLASPRYGERWGQHWLDLVRYADTAGDAADFPVPEAFKYRNYVISAFNEDRPYDQFIVEQIAGDLLHHSDEEQRWEQNVATGYIAISRRIGVSPHGLRHITLEDTIDNLGKTFLGLTISCARCHDHKFDPISQEDYYALYGILDSSVYPHPGAEHRPHRSDFVYRVGQEAADTILESHRQELQNWDRKERAQFEAYRDFQRKRITDPNRSRAKAWQQLLAIREQRRVVAESFPMLETAYAIREGEGKDAFVHKAGNPKDAGQTVARRFLTILGGQRLAHPETGSGRLELASWITSEQNPLTARVIANRIWQYHFGEGLVKTPSDFGIRGRAPTHPDLLDHLASQLIDHDWSIKHLQRQILLSDAYQRSAQHSPSNATTDPNNALLWQFNRRRLDAEQIRDSVLNFSESLDLSAGERHPFDHRLTYFYRQHEPFVGEYPSHRRSIYLMRQRIRKNDYLDLFDGPDGNLHLPKRNATTTPLQALYLMNSDFIHQHSKRIAKRAMNEASHVSDRVDWCFETIFGRSANQADKRAAERQLQSLQSKLVGDENELQEGEQLAWAAYIRSMLCSNSFMFVE